MSRTFSIPEIHTNVHPFPAMLRDSVRNFTVCLQQDKTQGQSYILQYCSPLLSTWVLRDDIFTTTRVGAGHEGGLISRMTGCCLRYLAFWSQFPNHRERQSVLHGIETAELLTEQPGKHWDHLQEKRALVRHELLVWTSFPDQLVNRKYVKLSASDSLWQEWPRHSSGMHHPRQSCITWQTACWHGMRK